MLEVLSANSEGERPSSYMSLGHFLAFACRLPKSSGGAISETLACFCGSVCAQVVSHHIVVFPFSLIFVSEVRYSAHILSFLLALYTRTVLLRSRSSSWVSTPTLHLLMAHLARKICIAVLQIAADDKGKAKTLLSAKAWQK